MAENVRLFDAAIKQAGAKTALYMTWARQHAPQTQEAIASAYAAIGEELGAIVIPVGLAWQDFLANHDKPLLYDRDQSHPTLAGSYLATCVFLAALLGQNPVGISPGPAGLEPPAIAALQRVAWKRAAVAIGEGKS